MKLMSCATIAALTGFATVAAAHDYKIADLEIMHPMAFETIRTAQTAAGFVSITNGGDTADRLIAVEADFPRVEIHTTVMDGDIARMTHLQEGVVIAAGDTVMLRPGGMHVMFMGLAGDPFEVGEDIPATLVFETAGRVDVVFSVEARDPEMDHDTMDHSAHHMKTHD